MPVFNRYLGIGVESVYGTAATPTILLDMAGESVELREDYELIQPSRFIMPTRTVLPRRFVRGTVDALLGWTNVGHVIKLLMGSLTSANLGSGAYTHTKTPTVQVNPSSFTLDIPRDVQCHRYTGMVATSARMGIGSPEHFGLSLTLLGKDETLRAADSVNDSSFEAPAFFPSPDADPSISIALDDGSTSWAGKATQIDLELSWARELRQPPRFQTPTGFLTKGDVRARVRIRWFYDTDTSFLYDCYREETDLELVLDLLGATIAGGSGLSRRLRFTFPVCRVTGRPPTVRRPGGGNIDHEFVLEPLDAAHGVTAPFTVELRNGTSSY